MNKENFVWTLKSKVTIKALGRTVNDLKLNKDLVLNGTYLLPLITISSS